MMSLTRYTYILIALALTFIILQELEAFIVPFIFSVGTWMVIRKLRSQVLGVFPKIPYLVGTLLSTLIILSFLLLFTQIIGSQVAEFYTQETIEKYSKNGQSIWKVIQDKVGIELLNELGNHILELDFSGFFQSFFGMLSNVLGNSFMVLLYLLFILLEETSFKNKLKAIYPDSEQREQVSETISQIISSVESYLTLKTIVSLITGFASFIALKILNVDFAMFWALLIFLLNYIPTVGSLIATIFPAVVALIEFQEVQMFFLVLVIIGVIQLVVGNIVEPKIMGDSLNISGLVVILSLTLWGMIWGIVGMILSVPITVVMIIIFSKIPSTKSIAILLSANGKIN